MDYDMYTEAGNAMIHGIVTAARLRQSTWAEVYAMLQTVSEIEGFGEATDTAVRECVFDALGFQSGFYR